MFELNDYISKLIFRWLRQHPSVLGFQFKKSVKRAQIANAIDDYIGNTIGNGLSRSRWESLFEVIPAELTTGERRSWSSKLKGVVLSSDAFFPFSDNIERAVQVYLINLYMYFPGCILTIYISEWS